MPTKKTDSEAEKKIPGIEENFTALESIIKTLESGEGSLEETFAGYEAGMRLIRTLEHQIDKVEKQIQILREEEDGDEREGDI